MNYIFTIISLALIVSSCAPKDTFYYGTETVWQSDHKINSNSIVIHNEAIYGHTDSSILKLKLNDGSKIWEIVNQGSYLSSKPLVIGEDIYFAGRHILQKVNSEGHIVWKINSGQKTYGLAKYENLIINCRTNKGLCANDMRTGEEVWSIEPNYQLISPTNPAISEDMVFVGNLGYQEGQEETELCCLDLRTQKKVWSYKDELCDNYGQPVTDSDFVYFNVMDGYQDGYSIKLNKRTGNLIWRIKSYPEVAIKPLLKDSIIYISSFKDGIKAINKESGEVVINALNVETQSQTELLFHENSVIFGSPNRELISVDKNGKISVISKFDYGIGNPIKYKEVLYVMDGNGKLFKIGSY